MLRLNPNQRERLPMSLVVSHQQREQLQQSESSAADYDWPFAVDRCEIVRDGSDVRIYFWSGGVKEVGSGLTIPASIAGEVGEALTALAAEHSGSHEIEVPAA